MIPRFHTRRAALEYLKKMGWKLKRFWRDGSVTVSHKTINEGYDVFKIGKEWKVERVWEGME